jgi:hypothetical protein
MLRPHTRKYPICGFVTQKLGPLGIVPKLYGGGKCFNFSEKFHDDTSAFVSQDRIFSVVFKDSACESCETFS